MEATELQADLASSRQRTPVRAVSPRTAQSDGAVGVRTTTRYSLAAGTGAYSNYESCSGWA